MQVHLTPQVEHILREFYKASVIANEKRPDLSIDRCFASLVNMSRGWSDETMLANMGETKARDAEICLQQAVKCHAIVLSLSTATPCRQKLEVPGIVKFFRSVIDAAVSDLSEMRMHKEGGVSIFGTSDMAHRKRARGWIDRIVLNKCLEIVPVGMFARRPAPSPVVSEDEGSDFEVEPRPRKKKPVEPVPEEKEEAPVQVIKIEAAVAAEGAKAFDKIAEEVAATPAATEPSIAVAIPPIAIEPEPEAKRISDTEKEEDDEEEEDDGEEEEDEEEEESDDQKK